MPMHNDLVTRALRTRLREPTVVSLVVLQCATLGVAMGGCRVSARDDFISTRAATLEPVVGDASAFRESRRLPVPGFVHSEPLLTRAPDE